ncbi:MAG: hypothetical protein V7754_10205 [Halioglobus sp.]
MSNLLFKNAGYKGTSLVNEGGLIPKAHKEKVYQWCKHHMACISAGVCMLLLSPFFALLAACFVLLGIIVKLESFGLAISLEGCGAAKLTRFNRQYDDQRGCAGYIASNLCTEGRVTNEENDEKDWNW